MEQNKNKPIVAEIKKGTDATKKNKPPLDNSVGGSMLKAMMQMYEKSR